MCVCVCATAMTAPVCTMQKLLSSQGFVSEDSHPEVTLQGLSPSQERLEVTSKRQTNDHQPTDAQATVADDMQLAMLVGHRLVIEALASFASNLHEKTVLSGIV